MTTERPQVSETGRYSRTEVARRLGLCYNTVHKLVMTGAIKVIHTRDHNIKISGQEVLRYWNTH